MKTNVSDERQRYLPGAIAARPAHRPARWPGRFLERGGDDLRGKVEIGAQELDPVVGEIPVVVHPRKGLANVLLRFEALHQLNHLQIWDINIRMLCEIVILLRIANSLCIIELLELIRLRERERGKSD